MKIPIIEAQIFYYQECAIKITRQGRDTRHYRPVTDASRIRFQRAGCNLVNAGGARIYMGGHVTVIKPRARPPAYVEPTCDGCGQPLASDDIDAGEITCLECAGLAVQALIRQEGPLLARVRVTLGGEEEAGL